MTQTLATESEKYEQAVLDEYLKRMSARAKGKKFLDFVTYIAPWFIIEEAHLLIAKAFDEIANNEYDRLAIFMPPRTGKSQLTSVFLPLWWIGRFDSDQILHTSYAATLVEKFGRQIRNLLLSDPFSDVFPDVSLTKDSKAAAQWAVTGGGVYNAAGVGAGIAGKGFNLGIIDDPISEQDMFSSTVMENVWEWYGAGFYTRRQPERNIIVLTMTRWNTADLAGRALSQSLIDPNADKWEVLKLSAILDEEGAAKLNGVAQSAEAKKYIEKPYTYKAGDSFSPRRWPKSALLRTKAQVTSKVWASLYQQSPYEEEGGILPRASWNKWKYKEPPPCEYVLQVYDTAFEEKEVSDYSVRLTWGLFRREDGMLACILLERMRQRLAFPDLRENAYEAYQEYQPDRVLIEKKASGHSLIQELRRRGVPVSPLEAKGSKFTRAHAASVVLEQGLVYYMPRKWADEIIDECAAFPNSPHDDAVDAAVHTWLYLRRMFHLRFQQELDAEDIEKQTNPKKLIRKHKRYLRIPVDER